MRNTYVFVHGAWLGGWCWEEVKPLLEKQGHCAVAVDLPGHGEDTRPIEQQDMETYTQCLVDLLQTFDHPVILVGHSMGGMSISQAASRVPEKVKKLVYVTAFLPKNGQSNDGLDNGIKPTDWKALAAQGIAVKLDESGTITELLPEFAAEALYNDISEERGKAYTQRHGRETMMAQYQPVTLTPAFETIPKVYVRCSLDTIMLPEMQDRMIQDTYCEAVYTLEAGHSPYFSKPAELADILLKMN